jgi:hypothetical protein
LQRALAVRTSLGDEGGAAVTRHNLEHLEGRCPPSPVPDRGRDDRSPGRGHRRWRWIALLAALLAVLLVVYLGGKGEKANDSLIVKTDSYSVRVEPAEIDFDDEPVGGNGSKRGLTVVNTGPTPVTVGQAVVSGATPGFAIVGDTCANREVPPGGRCHIEVGFRPSEPGPHRAGIRLPLPDRTTPVDLRGRGIVPSGPPQSSIAPGDTGPGAVSTTASSPGVIGPTTPGPGTSTVPAATLPPTTLAPPMTQPPGPPGPPPSWTWPGNAIPIDPQLPQTTPGQVPEPPG